MPPDNEEIALGDRQNFLPSLSRNLDDDLAERPALKVIECQWHVTEPVNAVAHSLDVPAHRWRNFWPPPAHFIASLLSGKWRVLAQVSIAAALMAAPKPETPGQPAWA